MDVCWGQQWEVNLHLKVSSTHDKHPVVLHIIMMCVYVYATKFQLQQVFHIVSFSMVEAIILVKNGLLLKV